MRATWLFAQAQRLSAQDRIDEALAAFEQVLALWPRSAGVHLHWALALSEAARVEEAVHAMHQAMALQPRQAVLPLFLGQILFDHARYAEASAWCQQAVARNPQQQRSLALLALIDMARGHLASGCQRLQQPQRISLTIEERLALRCGLRQPPPLHQQNSSMWQSRLLLVVESYLLQHEPTARTLASQLVEASPESQDAQTVSAMDRRLTHGVMGLTRLMYRLRYANRPAQRNAWLLYAKAEEAMYLGQFAEAVQLYKQLNHTFPARHRVEERLYEIAYLRGDFRRALQHWRCLADTNGSSSVFNEAEALQQGELQYQVGDYEGAAATLARITTRQWRDYRLPYYQGLCHLRTGAVRAARRCFAEAVSLINPAITTRRLDELHRVAQCMQAEQLAPASPLTPSHGSV